MGSKSDYLENKVLDHALGTAAFTIPTNVFTGLFTVTPSDAGGGTEVTGGSYARQDTNFSAAAAGATSNSGVVTYPTATADWGTVVAFGVYDAVSAGNLLYWGAISPTKTIQTGDTASFATSALTITED
jgi:hypothetical protein